MYLRLQFETWEHGDAVYQALHKYNGPWEEFPDLSKGIDKHGRLHITFSMSERPETRIDSLLRLSGLLEKYGSWTVVGPLCPECEMTSIYVRNSTHTSLGREWRCLQAGCGRFVGSDYDKHDKDQKFVSFHDLLSAIALAKKAASSPITGRMSATRPKTSIDTESYSPPAGRAFFNVDYEQLEMRTLASVLVQLIDKTSERIRRVDDFPAPPHRLHRYNQVAIDKHLEEGGIISVPCGEGTYRIDAIKALEVIVEAAHEDHEPGARLLVIKAGSDLHVENHLVDALLYGYGRPIAYERARRKEDGWRRARNFTEQSESAVKMMDYITEPQDPMKHVLDPDILRAAIGRIRQAAKTVSFTGIGSGYVPTLTGRRANLDRDFKPGEINKPPGPYQLPREKKEELSFEEAEVMDRLLHQRFPALADRYKTETIVEKPVKDVSLIAGFDEMFKFLTTLNLQDHSRKEQFEFETMMRRLKELLMGAR